MTNPIRRPRRDDGYAALAAVLASACFALVAAQVARTSRSGVVGVNADKVHARLAAAADAGLAIALDHILADDPAARWDIDGQPYAAPFDNADLSIKVEDEAGKLPLNRLNEDQVRAMFQLGGADVGTLDVLAQAFMDWRDPDKRRAGTDTPSGFRTVQELRRLPAMTAAVYDAIAPFATVDAGDVAFAPKTASPFALQVMGGGGPAGVSTIERQREADGEHTAFEAAPPPVSLVGRVLTIRIEASDGQGGRIDDATIVQLTGRPDTPYIVRQHYG